MATLLLLVIYIAFIGLGIPDSLFGTAWPAIYTEFDLPISFASFVTVIISCGTIVSSMFSTKIINRFGTNKVSAFSTALTAVALLGFSVSGSLWLLCIFAAYYESVGRSHAQKVPANPYCWDQKTVVGILENRQYTGCAVNFKTTTVSYKVHKTIYKPAEALAKSTISGMLCLKRLCLKPSAV